MYKFRVQNIITITDIEKAAKVFILFYKEYRGFLLKEENLSIILGKNFDLLSL